MHLLFCDICDILTAFQFVWWWRDGATRQSPWEVKPLEVSKDKIFWGHWVTVNFSDVPRQAIKVMSFQCDANHEIC